MKRIKTIIISLSTVKGGEKTAKQQVKILILTLVTALVFCGAVSATDYTVGPGQTYTTIGSAVAAATDGDNIQVNPNSGGNPYTEQVEINHNLTLKANGTVTVAPTSPTNNVFNVRPSGSNSGSGTTIQGFTITGPTSGVGISLAQVNNCRILNNTIINCTTGVNVYQSNNDEISGNTIIYTGLDYSYGVYVDGSSDNIINNNITMTGNGAGDTRGIHTWGDSHIISGNTVTIINPLHTAAGIGLNSDSGNGHNIEIIGNTISCTGQGQNYELEFNSAYSNTAWGNNFITGRIKNDGNNNLLNFNRISNESSIWSTVAFDARYNWFGSNSGPTINQINGESITYNPWLVMTVTASPTTIYTGGISTVTADFTHDSLSGVHIPSLGHFPDGIGVLITSIGGSVGSSSTTAYTSNGAAVAHFKADQGPGTGSASGSLDSQDPLNVSIIILQSLNSNTSVNAATVTTVNAATVKTINGKTVGMEETGAPIVPLALGIISVLGGLATRRRRK